MWPFTTLNEILKSVDWLCAKANKFTQQLSSIQERLDRIMAALDDALAAIKKIDDATTRQSIVLQSIADSEQKTSDELDVLIGKLSPGTTITPELIASLKATAERAQAVSDALDAQAAFSAALAAKGSTDPVPLPVPPSPPIP